MGLGRKFYFYSREDRIPGRNLAFCETVTVIIVILQTLMGYLKIGGNGRET